MVYPDTRPVYLIVNIKPVIEKYAKYPSLYALFPHVSLSDLIESVMLVDIYHCAYRTRIPDLVWQLLEEAEGTKHLPGEYLQALEEIFYQLRFSIQERIEPVLPMGWGSNSLVFHQWLGPHDIIIKPDA